MLSRQVANCSAATVRIYAANLARLRRDTQAETLDDLSTAALQRYLGGLREHWKSLRTTNPIESIFDSVRLRTRATRRMRTARTGLHLVFQLVRQAEGRWRRLDAPHLVVRILDGVRFVNGLEVRKASKRRVAA